MSEFPHSDGTAAELLVYFERQVATKGAPQLVRGTLADQEWILSSTDGAKYTFDLGNFFGKKHLVSFTKKDAKLAAKVKEVQSRGFVGDATAEANKELAYGKAAKVYEFRSGAVVCMDCGHPRTNHIWKKKGIFCNGEKGCPCVSFESPFVKTAQAKYNHKNPFMGAKIAESTCIVMNFIPRAIFEQTLVGSIKTKTPAAKKDEFILEWDFGHACKGAVVQVTGTDQSTWVEYQGCKVVAALKPKEPKGSKDEHWTVQHMEEELI